MMRCLSILTATVCLLLSAAHAQLPEHVKRAGLPARLESQLGELLVAPRPKVSARSMAVSFHDEQVEVIIEPRPDVSVDAVLSRFVEHPEDLAVVRTSESLILAKANLEGLRLLSDIDEILNVRRPARPERTLNISEGLALIGAESIAAGSGAGSGVDVAIIDSEFELLTSAQFLGELPPGVRTDITGDGLEIGGGPHGTACAEIIHDIAPGARLHYVRVDNTVDFQNAVRYVIDNEIDVVSMSLAWFGTSAGDGEGATNRLVDEAAANGVFWVNSAGNQANKVATGFYTDLDGSGFHDFEPGSDLLLLHGVDAGETIDVFLTWQGWPLTLDDYDLALYRLDTVVPIRVASADGRNVLSPPRERITHVAEVSATYGISVHKAPAATSLGIQVVSRVHEVGNGIPSLGTISTPGDARGAFAVGAINYRNWSSGPVENFSSRGPTTDGRLKPEVIAPDAVTTFGYQNDFFGTSASCPHAAGAAAVLIASDPYYNTPERVRTALLESVVDMGTAGPDNVHGHGRLDLRVLAASRAPDISLSTTALDLGETSSSASSTFQVRNVGRAILQVAAILSDNSAFSFSPTEFRVEPAGSRDVTVTFSPVTGGTVNAVATITSNADRFPEARLGLRGTGLVGRPAVPILSMTVDARDFGPVSVGDTKRLVIPVANAGTGMLEVTADVAGAAAFTLTPGTLSLGPQATAIYTVTFTPDRASEFASELRISSNDTRRPSLTIPLLGVGAEAASGFTLSLDANPEAGDQGVTTASTSGSHAIQVFSSDLANATGLTLSLALGDGVAFSTFEPGDVLPNPEYLHRPTDTNLELTVASLGGRAGQSGYLGQITLEGSPSATTLVVRLDNVSVRRNGFFERYTDLARSIGLGGGPVSPDFDGDGEVGFSDFLLFAAVFGTAAGDDAFDPRFDLDTDGAIGFPDFLAFATAFGG